MTKTYPHAVIYNGVYYPPDTPIEVEEEKAATPEEETTATPEEETTAKPKAKKAVKNDNA